MTYIPSTSFVECLVLFAIAHVPVVNVDLMLYSGLIDLTYVCGSESVQQARNG